MLKEYTFLGNKGFRCPHFKAHNLKDAIVYSRIWALNTPDFGELTGAYQIAKENDYVMSEWRYFKR